MSQIRYLLMVAALSWLVPQVAASDPNYLSGQESKAKLVRPEEDSAFLQGKEFVLTLRRSGEFTSNDQVTLYKGDNRVVALIRGESVGPAVEREVNSTLCSELENLWDSLQGLSLDFRPALSFYAPAITYQLWASSLVEERYARLYAPDPTAEETAYWGSDQHPAAEVAHTLASSFEVALGCLRQGESF